MRAESPIELSQSEHVGWRARLGVLVPSTNNMLERDAHIFLPNDVTAHFARMKYERGSKDPLAALSRYAAEAADLLSDAHVDAIAFGCTTGSLKGGLGYDRNIIELIENAAGVPATTTATALVDALNEVAAKKVTLVTPYTATLNADVVRFLEQTGFKVGGVFGFEIGDPDGIPVITPEEIVDAVMKTDSDDADAVFLSCTAMRGIDAIAALRRTLAKPVLSSNQVTYWKFMQLLDDPGLYSNSGYSEILQLRTYS